ncbi:DUF2306 domain-containing protein [Tahibacter amnicola]|uniref:Membrane protein DUF2306 n=1 Tax=Tahibacter amnicola TaxID=2976241 RepID=A0ABY6BLL4_9GAMM|nr:DUF2306 domain-containing protein [Tahibacter amnicola]UXI70516.1 hypothetical protein N4264_13020 [Tahibacter amnicola]
MTLLIHISAGLVSLAAGAVALYAAKGSGLHKRSGLYFVAAMLVMSSTGAVIAARMPERGSMLVGLLTFYFVTTGLLAVRRTVDESRGLLTGLMAAAIAITLANVVFGVTALNSPNGRVDHLPAFPFFFFATFGALAVIGDWRLLRAGALQGPRRIARHLWRLGFALFVATSSFFLGQAKLFPEPIRKSGVLALPVLLVVVLTIYWLARTLRRRRQPA